MNFKIHFRLECSALACKREHGNRQKAKNEYPILSLSSSLFTCINNEGKKAYEKDVG